MVANPLEHALSVKAPRRRMRQAGPSGLTRARPMPCLAMLAALLVAGPALSQGYATRDVGPWTVSPGSDRAGCFLTRTYRGPGETTVLLGLDGDGANRLTILNANWSIRERDRLRLTFRLSGASFPRHLAVGISADGRKGFVAGFGATFPDTFAASKFLRVVRGDVPVEDLDLAGSGAAVAELRRCVDLYRSRPVTTGAEKANRIPIDPFATNTGRKTK